MSAETEVSCMVVIFGGLMLPRSHFAVSEKSRP